MHGPLTTYHIEISLLNGETRVFNNCKEYSSISSGGFKIVTERNETIKFFGTFSVEVISMDDYENMCLD